MPSVGHKTADYPFGYGWCACGCGKRTKFNDGRYMRFFNARHHPEYRRHKSSPKKLKQPIETPAINLNIGPGIKQPCAEALRSASENPRLQQALAWAKTNTDYIAWHTKQLRAKSDETKRQYFKSRRKNDPAFRLALNLRSRVHAALRRQRQRKDLRTEELLGCTIKELKLHLESKFVTGMSWENYGKWHVDHIRPCAAFNLLLPEEQRACFHYSNLQPLWGPDNQKKSSYYLGSFVKKTPDH